MENLNIINKVWGSELIICNSNLYCGKILKLKKGYRCSNHYHVLKHETFFILSGKVKMEYGTSDGQLLKCIEMRRGDSIVFPQFVSHRFTGLEDSEILEISTQDFKEDSYRFSSSEKVE